MSDINANPPPVEAFGGCDRGAAPAEGVKHHGTLFTPRTNKILQERFGFLCGIAEPFLCRRRDRLYVGYEVIRVFAHWIELLPSIVAITSNISYVMVEPFYRSPLHKAVG